MPASGLWLFVRGEDSAHVVDRIPFRELAPRQRLGRSVREGILLLVVPKLATPRGIHDDRGPAEGHLFRLPCIDSSRSQI